MLIPIVKLTEFITYPIKGVIHCGAHQCEEEPIYDELQVPQENRLWIDALNIHPKVYQATLWSEDNMNMEFHIANNIQSSSLLEFGTHKDRYPYVSNQLTIKVKTITLSTLIKQLNLDMTKYNFLNLDLQGVELQAILGMINNIHNIDYIYTEVNSEEVYKRCATLDKFQSVLDYYGFEMIWIDKEHLDTNGWSDALFRRRLDKSNWVDFTQHS